MKRHRFLGSFAVLLSLCDPSHALDIQLVYVAGTSAEAQQAFETAAARWEAILADDVSLDMTVGIQTLGAGVFNSSGFRRSSFSYTSVRTALAADQDGPLDATAVGSLPAGSLFGVLINRTSDNPNGSGSATPYLDLVGANNSTINLTTANAKALGLDPGTGTVGQCVSTCDASIVFGAAFLYDFDPSDGIAPGAYDFVGFATHEIGHALGFVSGVDILDINSPPVNGPFAANQFTFVSALDLYRYSDLSTASGVLDFTADTRAKGFSIDGGTTDLATFANGRNFGDGQQAGHWKANLGIGLMDPTRPQGIPLAIGPRDIEVFDVIGWNVVPEPSTSALLGGGIAGLAGFAARRKRTLAPAR